ncbi:MAG: hypothetical protein WCK29_00835 [archaeon]
MLKKAGKKGQVAIFVIVAIVIVAAIGIFFLVRANIGASNIPTEFAPVYSYYESCITFETKAALDLAGSQGGFVQLPALEPGSAYAPFSNQLNFVGLNVPYWYYLTSNGMVKQNVPSQSDMEKGIADYVAAHLDECDFSQFYAQGMTINYSKPSVVVNLDNSKTSVVVSSSLSVSRNESSARRDKHSVDINTKIGKFYTLAKEIYAEEQKNQFLENYTMDTLFLNAPVDGVEISCSPKVWKSNEVASQLLTALENNIQSIKFQGNYYDLKNKEDKYFVVPKTVDENVNLLYSKQWPTKLEINGDGVDSQLMVAKTVGNQPGLGVMGFCYAPYHFVYDLSFPVMVQISDNNELFQFPMAVVIDKNVPRQSNAVSIDETKTFDLCSGMNQDLSANVYDINLNPVDADLSFKCFDQVCPLGKTSNGIFNGKAPTCLNGYLITRADGFVEKKDLISTNEQNSIDVILNKNYNESIELYVDGTRFTSGNAIVLFNGANSVSTTLPDNSNVMLAEGSYNLSVYIYGNSSITIPASTKTQCTKVPQSGIMGFFGSTKEQCYNIDVPETSIESALIGGGQNEVYLLPSDLETGKIKLEVSSLPVPTTMDQLQNNFELFSTKGVDLQYGP